MRRLPPTASSPLALEPTSQSALDQLFPVSKDVNVLVEPFRHNVRQFLSALGSAGATMSIISTYQPPERQYIKHYAYAIAKQGRDPESVPAMECLEFTWKRKAADGSYSLAESRRFAQSVVDGLGIAYEPALISRHMQGRAIDMHISWEGTLSIRRADGRVVVINDEPRSEANPQLWEVGRSYNVIKLVSDPPHWSSDGQ